MIAVASSIATIAVLEFGAGLLIAGGWRQPSNSSPGDTVDRALEGLDLNPAPLVYDPDLLWRNALLARKTQSVNPRRYGRADEWTIENNSEGFRGPERARDARRADVYRILFIGDSITFGFNVDQDAPFARRVADWLTTRYPERQFDVINAGVPGWTWAQGLKFLEREGLALHPNLIVAAHGTNDRFWPAKVTDIERLERAQGPISRYLAPIVAPLARTNTYRLLLRLWPETERGGESEGCKKQIASTGVCRRLSLDDVASSVREFARQAASSGSDLLILDLDFLQTGAARSSRAAAAQAGVPFLDLVEQLSVVQRRVESDRAARLGLMSAGEIGRAGDRPAGAAPRKLVLRVLVPASADEISVKGVVRTGIEEAGSGFDEKMYDDGTRGDEVAGDHVFTTTIDVPRGAAQVEYKFFAGTSAEFEPLPPLPSTMGDRVIRVQRYTLAPVEVFGEMPFMAEQTHPNRNGHEIIASRVEDAIEQLPAFRAFVARPRGVGAAGGISGSGLVDRPAS